MARSDIVCRMKVVALVLAEARRSPPQEARRAVAKDRSRAMLLKPVCFLSSPFAGLVAFAERSDPIPSRTRPSNASAPMVLCLKTWESRSPPGPPKARTASSDRLPVQATRIGSDPSDPWRRRSIAARLGRRRCGGIPQQAAARSNRVSPRRPAAARHKERALQWSGLRRLQGWTITIQETPKRSATIPNRGEKNVFPIGMCAVPPSESAEKTRSASVASFAA